MKIENPKLLGFLAAFAVALGLAIGHVFVPVLVFGLGFLAGRKA